MTLIPWHHAAHLVESDGDNWREWLDEHLDRFLLFARQQTRGDADAEDVLQDALVESWRRAGGREPEPAHVFACIRRRAIDLGRSTDRRARREQFTTPAEVWFEPDFNRADETDLLANSVRALRPEYAEVLTLRIWGELTFREIAGTLEIPQNTAASRYRNALAELRRATKGMLR